MDGIAYSLVVSVDECSSILDINSNSVPSGTCLSILSTGPYAGSSFWGDSDALDVSVPYISLQSAQYSPLTSDPDNLL